MSNIYTSKDLNTQAGTGEISLNDIVMLNGNNIVSSINIVDPLDGKLNPIPSYNAVVDATAFLSGQLSTTQENVESAFTRIDGIDETIESMSASFELTSRSQTSVVTAIHQANGKIDIQARGLVSSDVGNLDGFVIQTSEKLKEYVDESFLSLSGGTLTGNLNIERDYGLSVRDGIDAISADGQTLRKIIDDSISLSTDNAVKTLSTELQDDFEFGYDKDTNMISAHVAGKTLAFSASRFTEATMLSNVHVDQDGILWLIFKTEDPTATTTLTVDLKEIMPLYDGESGIDIEYNGHGRYTVSADSTIVRQSTIDELNVTNVISPGMILSSLSQENGKIAYSTTPILSNYVNGLSDYVNYALSTFNMPLSALYSEWTTLPSAVNGNAITIQQYVDADRLYFVPCISNLVQGLAKQVSIDDPYSLVWHKYELTGDLIHDIESSLTATRSAIKYILGSHADKPIQPYGDYATNSDLQLSVSNLLDALSGDISCTSLTTPKATIISAAISRISGDTAEINEATFNSISSISLSTNFLTSNNLIANGYSSLSVVEAESISTNMLYGVDLSANTITSESLTSESISTSTLTADNISTQSIALSDNIVFDAGTLIDLSSALCAVEDDVSLVSSHIDTISDDVVSINSKLNSLLSDEAISSFYNIASVNLSAVSLLDITNALVRVISCLSQS